MSFPKNVTQAVIEHVQGIEGWNECMNLAAAANADLHYGDTSSEDYPGFGKACSEVQSWLADIAPLFVDEDSGCVSDREPEGEYREIHDGASDTEEWYDPEPFYTLERKDIASILFGSELAVYL